MKAGFILRDDPPTRPDGLRPTTWHVAALLASGFQVRVHETKDDQMGRVWRTWRATESSVFASPDPDISKGAAHCEAAISADPPSASRMAHRRPFSPYLAAFLGARNFDLLDAWRRRGGPGYVSNPIKGGASPLVELRDAGTVPDLAELALGTPVKAKIAHEVLAAALVTAGFPLAGMTPSGIPQLLGIVPAGKTAPHEAESLLCQGLSFAGAQAASQALEGVVEAQNRANSADIDFSHAGPLEAGHLFVWAWFGALRRFSMRRLEGAMGHDNSKIRSHVLRPKRSRINDGLGVVCTSEEYNANEDRILAHLRGL